MDLAIIFISLLLLMFFAYRGFSLIFIAPIFAVLAAITSDYTSMPVYSELYMTKAAEYIKSYYCICSRKRTCYPCCIIWLRCSHLWWIKCVCSSFCYVSICCYTF